MEKKKNSMSEQQPWALNIYQKNNINGKVKMNNKQGEVNTVYACLVPQINFLRIPQQSFQVRFLTKKITKLSI